MEEVQSPVRKRKLSFFKIGLGIFAFIFSIPLVLITFGVISIFVIQPIGALPEGRTIVLLRESSILNRIDSADAICFRELKNVNLLCRGIILGTVLEKNYILLKLPYSETLYKISTEGREYTN